MSAALDSSRGMREIQSSGYVRGGIVCVATPGIFDSLPESRLVDKEEEEEAEAEVNECSSSASSTTSSIGKNSDLSGRESLDGHGRRERERE
uniref:Uncharacterized protein n=1 Tax=Manihot esculenta TaxID=3983 RepID=A0A2C9W0E8_MANES